MSDETIQVGEKLYEVAVQFTDVTEFGVSLEALLAGETPPPPEGARIDVYFEGTISGERINGAVKGVDYLCFRADGRAELHIHGTITTPDGANVSFFGDGLVIDDGSDGPLQLRESVDLFSSHSEYTWVNGLALWGVGTVDPVAGKVEVTVYSV